MNEKENQMSYAYVQYYYSKYSNVDKSTQNLHLRGLAIFKAKQSCDILEMDFRGNRDNIPKLF